MKVANGVDMLELSANLFTGPSIIHPALVYDKDEVILVDAGFPGQLSIIREAVEKAGNHHGREHFGSDLVSPLLAVFKTGPRGSQLNDHHGKQNQKTTRGLHIRQRFTQD